jgi:hypothetical protein
MMGDNSDNDNENNEDSVESVSLTEDNQEELIIAEGSNQIRKSPHGRNNNVFPVSWTLFPAHQLGLVSK